MILKFSKLNISILNFLRTCSYVEITNPHNNEISYARSLDADRFYPRFHIYVQESANQTIINLHLDAKKPSYQGSAAHSGEYEGRVVETEAQRIKLISEKFISKLPTNQSLGFTTKKPWWEKLFRKK